MNGCKPGSTAKQSRQDLYDWDETQDYHQCARIKYNMAKAPLDTVDRFYSLIWVLWTNATKTEKTDACKNTVKSQCKCKMIIKDCESLKIKIWCILNNE